jgi:hypothetical protein
LQKIHVYSYFHTLFFYATNNSIIIYLICMMSYPLNVICVFKGIARI